MATELSNPSCLRIFIEEMQQLYVGQSYDLYWTHNALCPSISEYLKMVDKKTGGRREPGRREGVRGRPVPAELPHWALLPDPRRLPEPRFG